MTSHLLDLLIIIHVSFSCIEDGIFPPNHQYGIVKDKRHYVWMCCIEQREQCGCLPTVGSGRVHESASKILVSAGHSHKCIPIDFVRPWV